MLLSLGACSASDSKEADSFVDAGAGRPECFSSNECPTGFSCSEFGTCVAPSPGGPDAGLAPEVEVELSPPTHSQRFVYVAMTELDALAKIDGQSLQVESIPVGDQPKVVAAIPGSDGVVVLDQNNATATIVRPIADGDDTRVVATLPNQNRISVDPTGSFAVAWFDLRKASQDAGGLGGVGAIGSFQDVTVIRLQQDNEVSVNLTVGFRPQEIEFDSTGSRAFVVTDDGVSVISLNEVVAMGPHIVPPIGLGTLSSTEPLDREVNVVSTGEFAVVRDAGESTLRIVDLSGDGIGGMSTLALSGAPSDVDLSADGLRAYAAIRNTNELAIVDLSQGLPEQSAVQVVGLPALSLGSMVISPQEDELVLFSNASSVESIVVVSLEEGNFSSRTLSLQKSVRSLGYDPSGQTLIVTHAKGAGNPMQSGLSFEEFINRSYGYSVVDVESGFGKLQITEVDTGEFQFSLSSPRAYVLLRGEQDSEESLTHIVDLDSGIVKEQLMGSPPETVGILPEAGVAFVNQTHALGRVSFIDVDSDAMRTVTGFDLNSRVVD